MVSGLNIEKDEPSTEKDVSKKNARRLQDSYHKIFQTMSEGFVLHEVICDDNGEPYDLRILDTNPVFEQLTGLRKEDVLGRTIRQVLPDEDPFLIKTLGTVALTGKPMEFENHSRALERYYKIICYSTTPLQVAALFSDISKEKDAENNIKKMEAINRAILNSIPDQVFILSDNGTFLDYRSPLGGMTYSPPKSFMGKTINEVMPAELASQIESKMVEAQKSSLVQIFEYKLPVKGKEKYYEARISPGLDGIFVTLVSNIDERKRMEQALLERLNLTGSGHCGCGSAGIQVTSSNNTVLDNVLYKNKYGIYVKPGAVNNTFISNEFLDNDIAASDSDNNSWSSSGKAEGLHKLTELLLGKKVQGNYYSDYDEPKEGCNDTNQDGFCDQPRNISGGSSVDLYPAILQGN